MATLTITTSLTTLIKDSIEEDVGVTRDALLKVEACLGTFLKEMGRNMARILDIANLVTVSADVVMLYADVGLHLSLAVRDRLNLVMQQDPIRPDDETVKRVSKSKQYGLKLAMKRVMDILDQGMQEQLTQKYNYSLSARVGCTWLAEQVTLHFLSDAVKQMQEMDKGVVKKLRGIDFTENWFHKYIGSQEMY